MRFGIAARLFKGQLAASAPDSFMGQVVFHELKSVAKGVSLPHHGVHFDRPCWQLEFQANYLPHRHFHEKHRGEAGLAYIHRVSADDAGIARVDANLDGELEPGMAAGLDELLNSFAHDLTAPVHSNQIPTSTEPPFMRDIGRIDGLLEIYVTQKLFGFVRNPGSRRRQRGDVYPKTDFVFGTLHYLSKSLW